MDEYLFITLAKLKADRLRREREQSGRQLEIPELEPAVTHKQFWLARLFAGEPRWRAQS